MRKIELLAPAANKVVAFEAIKHGADAVYMGASSHGARKKASNELDDIREVVEFAHKFRVRVYITVNTLVYEDEIKSVERLIRNLYEIGVDAIIIQDMGILRMNIPPIELHASTQCDTRTLEKARFLESVGFSQIVLARELSIEEIRKICKSVTIPIECFIHGALCVSYSGRCRASYVETGRSGNRGECAQMCRLPYSLTDARGKMLEKNKYLLSLRDLNLSKNIEDMMDAGVSSFKIEGRLKDVEYVKNITALYRKIIDSVIDKNPEKYCRSSFGKSIINFEPCAEKSFNRGFTTYFFNRHSGCEYDIKMASLDTPKSKGEKICDISILKNGDGISFINSKGEYEGVRINKIEGSKIIGAHPFNLPNDCEIRRTFNREWHVALEKTTANRLIDLDIEIDQTGISAKDDRGTEVRILMDAPKSVAIKPMQPDKIIGKLGGTIYRLRNFENRLDAETFIPASYLSALKRKLLQTLDLANELSLKMGSKREEKFIGYDKVVVESEENIANSLAESFYKDHGVEVRSWAIETESSKDSDSKGELVVMTTRYCIRRELGCCKKKKFNIEKKWLEAKEPFYISSGIYKFRLKFDCSRCEMSVISNRRQSQLG